MYVYLIISLLVLALLSYYIYSTNSKEHYVNRYSGRNMCGEADAGPMDRPKIRPSCFYYDIDKENEKIYGVMDNVSKRLDGELTRAQNINDQLSSYAIQNTNKINNLLSGPIVMGIEENLGAGLDLLSSSSKSSLYSANNADFYNFDRATMMNKIRSEIDKYLSNVIDKIMEQNNIKFSDAVNAKFTVDMKHKISNPITMMFLEKFNKDSEKDIVKIMREIIKEMDVASSVQILIDNAVLSDPSLKSFLGTSKNIQIGDFVYFKHKLSQPVPDICADNEATMTIIVGGRVCALDAINKTARISYNFVMNPNKNPRCQGLKSTQPKEINYDFGPEGLPKWYPISTEVSDCGINAPDALACSPAQWDESRDNWVKMYIGGFNKDSNEMACGVGPTAFNLPQEVPVSILFTDLDRLVYNCGGERLKIKEQQRKEIVQQNIDKQFVDVVDEEDVIVPADSSIIQNLIINETSDISTAIPNLTQTPTPSKPKIEKFNYPITCKQTNICLDLYESNNKADKFLQKRNGNKYYFKDGKMIKDDGVNINAFDETWKGEKIEIVRIMLASGNIFAYAKKIRNKKYGIFILESKGFRELTSYDLEYGDFSTINIACCFPTKK